MTQRDCLYDDSKITEYLTDNSVYKNFDIKIYQESPEWQEQETNADKAQDRFSRPAQITHWHISTGNLSETLTTANQFCHLHKKILQLETKI